MSNKNPELAISPGDSATTVGEITLQDCKIIVQVIDRLFSMGGVKGQESLPIAITRARIMEKIRPTGEKEEHVD